MSDRKSSLEQALDLFVYAPIGLLAVAREELPRLIERGHQELSQQATVARMMGEYAVGEGRKEAGQRLQQASEALNAVTSSLSERRNTAPTGAPAPPASTTAASPPATAPSAGAPASAPTASAPPASSAPTASGAPSPPSPPAAPRPSVDGLAIPGYDALSASQVVQRLAGLSPDELSAVREYEAATRGRKTILNRVEQLRTEPQR